jgi:hypothetical protein
MTPFFVSNLLSTRSVSRLLAVIPRYLVGNPRAGETGGGQPGEDRLPGGAGRPEGKAAGAKRVSQEGEESAARVLSGPQLNLGTE